MDHWNGSPVPAMRREAVHGDRVVRCFVDRPRSVHAMFSASVSRSPDADAVVFDGRRWTYVQTDRASARIAAALASRGVARGDRVVMFVDNRPEFVFVWLALQRLGAVAVPVGVREQRPGLAYIARQCGATAIVADGALVDRIPDAADAPLLRLRIAVGALPDGAAAAGFVSLSPLAGDTGDTGDTADFADTDAGPAATTDPAAVAESDVAVILYTSGTTGNPKGAMLTHANIAHSAMHFAACMQLEPTDRSALVVPASHVTGLVAIIATMLQVGGAIVVVPVFKAAAFVALMAAERITHTLMVPAIYNLCLMQPAFATADLSAWRIGSYGGAPMPVPTIDALAERLPGLMLMNAYGATETTSPATLMPPGRTRDRADTVGVALPAVDIAVMDDDGREMPRGETGELWIAGPMVSPGYWDDAAATAASFTAGWWHSGDLGSVDADGYVRVFDRKKDMLNRGGFKIYSVEVENTLMAWPGMIEAAIVGRPCPVLGERVHAVVHAAAGSDADTAALRAFCAERLADYKVPETVTWSDAPLPRNANGKLMKRLLRDRIAAAAG